MNRRSFALGALAYLLVTFPLAVLWHLGLFGEQYDALGYFGREPVFAFGFLAILIQGLALSYLYGRTRGHGPPISEGLRFGAVAGSVVWSGNVLAFAAKTSLASVPMFFALETGYFVVNFALYGVALGRIYGPRTD